jgi:hypothetical protein
MYNITKIAASFSASGITITPKLPIAGPLITPKRSLNLEDYKKRRGLI